MEWQRDKEGEVTSDRDQPCRPEQRKIAAAESCDHALSRRPSRRSSPAARVLARRGLPIDAGPIIASSCQSRDCSLLRFIVALAIRTHPRTGRIVTRYAQAEA